MRWIVPHAQGVKLDTLPVVAATIRVMAPLQARGMRIDFHDGRLYCKDAPADSVLLAYRVFHPESLLQPSAFAPPVAVVSSSASADALVRETGAPPGQGLAPETLLPTAGKGLQKSGSITRGFSMGNQQDVFANSALNLQLEGELAEGLRLSAQLSDQQVPYQPEGNTQQLQQFDKVFISLQHRLGSISAGDVRMQSDSSYFLSFDKQVRGGVAELRLGQGTDRASVSRLGISMAKGQFHSATLQAQEGVSGPYRLTGPRNETYLIVIAGSERVYLDGRLLQRGWDADYVVDYNRAELTFTPRVLITSYSRLRVDFEYTSQMYSRSILTASHRQQLGRWSLQTQYYRESDNPRAPLMHTLGEEERRALAQAGNDPERMWVPSAERVEAFDANRLLYTLRTAPDGSSYYQRAAAQDTLLYAVAFSQVGVGKGDYRLAEISALGRVYAYVPPMEGIPQGDYAPLRRLLAPTRRQMAIFSSAYRLGDYARLEAELALSQQDQNLLSDQDDGQNGGWAARLAYRLKDRPLGQGWKWGAHLQAEYDHARFRPVERLRAAEYDRDWGLDGSWHPAEERLLGGGIDLRGKEQHLLYRADYRHRPGVLQGWQQQGNWQGKWKGFFWDHRLFWMGSSQQDTLSEGAPAQGRWLRYGSQLGHRGRWVTPAYAFSTERHALSDAQGMLLRSAQHFREHHWSLSQGDSLPLQFDLSYRLRDDEQVQQGAFAPQQRAHTLSAQLGQELGAHRWRLSATYRKVQHHLPAALQEEHLQGQADWQVYAWQRRLRSELTYATGTGRELKREFSFVRVETGRGTHTWRDHNGDGVQDLDEFFLAQFPDEMQYIKVFMPTTDYVPAYTAMLNYRLQLQLPAEWRKQGGWRSALARMGWQSSLLSEQKSSSSSLADRFLPFGTPEGLLSQRLQLRSALSFDRGNPRFSAELRWSRQQQRLLVTSGFEGRDVSEWEWEGRSSALRQWVLALKLLSRHSESGADYMPDRNYAIEEWGLSPELGWQPWPSFRLGGSFALRQKQGLQQEQRHPASLQTYGLELRWAQAKAGGSLQAEGKCIRIAYAGAENSSLAYELLDALRAGVNYTWGLGWNQRLRNGLQLQLQYNGRQSPQQRMVHIGRMQLTAMF